MFSATLSRIGWLKLYSRPGIALRFLSISSTMSSSVWMLSRHSLIGLSLTNTSRLDGSVGSVPSSGRPSWLSSSVISGIPLRMSAVILGVSLRPSVSEIGAGSVNVTYSEPSLSSGKNSVPRRGASW
jgi:hypothetical protein